MKASDFEDALRGSQRWLTYLKLIVAASLLGNIVQSCTVMKLLNGQKVIVTPPVINKPFWIAGQELDENYLEQMGLYWISLETNVTPANIEYNCGTLGSVAEPQDVGPLRISCDQVKQRLKQDAASTMMQPQTITPDLPHLRLAVAGNVTTYVSDHRVSDVHKVFAVSMAMGVDSHLYLKDLKETCDEDPFGVLGANGASACKRN